MKRGKGARRIDDRHRLVRSSSLRLQILLVASMIAIYSTRSIHFAATKNPAHHFDDRQLLVQSTSLYLHILAYRQQQNVISQEVRHVKCQPLLQRQFLLLLLHLAFAKRQLIRSRSKAHILRIKAKKRGEGP